MRHVLKRCRLALLSTCVLLILLTPDCGIESLIRVSVEQGQDQYMAWGILKDGGALRCDVNLPPRTVRRVILDGIWLNLLNPKLTIFFFAFLPQFVDAGDAAASLRMAQISGVFMAMTFVVFALYGVFAAAVREQVASRPAVLVWLRRGFAAAFIALGAKLALAQR